MNKVTPQDSPANAYVELGVVRLRSVESVTNSKINGDLEQIVLENDKAAPNRSISSLQPQHPLDDSPSVDLRGVAEDALEDVELLLAGVLAASNTPVVGVKGTTGAGRPDDRTETHGVRDCADTVV